MKSKIPLLLPLVLLSPSAQPLSFSDLKVEELFEKADMVASVTVLRISGECESAYRCEGYRIGSEVMTTIKESHSSVDGSRIEFCSKIPLDLGHTYTVFLYPPSSDPIGLEGCSFVLGHAGAFEERAGDFYRVNSPDSAVIFDLNGRTYYSNAVLEPKFVDEIRGSRDKK